MPHKAQPKTRECCLTRQSRPVTELVRFAVGPDGILVPDIDGRAGGRGAWVLADQGSVEQAMAKNAFGRSLKSPLIIPKDLAQLTAARLEQRVLGALGLARKAGQIAIGATKVEKAISAATIVALITASDGRPDGRRKMFGALKAAGLGFLPRYGSLSSNQLSLALGYENVIHAALTGGAAASSAMGCFERHHTYINGPDHKAGQQNEEAMSDGAGQNRASSQVTGADGEVVN
ncbi:MAG: RNA-binding protein [Alphaproteobacteria bacterium]|nr:RNA-binding protein [Alphaproteobacteria bacterium]